MYTVGYSNDGGFSQFGKIWKNKLPAVDVNNTAVFSAANSVFVLENDVYVGGVDRKLLTDNIVAKYWKNGVETVLTNGKFEASVYSVFATKN